MPAGGNIANPADLLRRVRRDISDEVATYRWSDAQLMEYVNDGGNELWDTHPEFFCGSAIQTAAPASIDDGDVATGWASLTGWNIAQRGAIALVHYVDWRVFSEDSEDASNAALADYHHREYEKIAPARAA